MFGAGSVTAGDYQNFVKYESDKFKVEAIRGQSFLYFAIIDPCRENLVIKCSHSDRPFLTSIYTVPKYSLIRKLSHTLLPGLQMTTSVF